MSLNLSPKQLAHAGITLDPYRIGSEREWYCQPCQLRLQNGLTGARAHYIQVHVRSQCHHAPPTLRLVAS